MTRVCHGSTKKSLADYLKQSLGVVLGGTSVLAKLDQAVVGCFFVILPVTLSSQPQAYYIFHKKKLVIHKGPALIHNKM